MKITRHTALLALMFAGLFGLAAHVASATEKSADPMPRPVRLQLQVDLPVSLNTLRNDDIAEAFAHRVVTALHEQGFKGRIKYVENGEPINPTLPVLSIHIFEWRVSRIGNTDCTFSALLKSPRGEKSLGLFSGTSIMTWLRHDWFARADSFEEAASDALNHLKARLEATGLIDAPVAPKG